MEQGVMCKNNTDKTVELIKEAFNDIPYPGDENITYKNQYVMKSMKAIRWQVFFVAKHGMKSL